MVSYTILPHHKKINMAINRQCMVFIPREKIPEKLLVSLDKGLQQCIKLQYRFRKASNFETSSTIR